MFLSDRVGTKGLIFLIAYFALMLICPISSPAEDARTRSPLVSTEPLHPFKHSDALAFSEAWNFEDYSDYGVTFVTWGGRRMPGVNGAVSYEGKLKRALRAGVKIGALFGTGRTESKRFLDMYPVAQYLDARCLTLDGKPIVVPERLKETYKGYPAYWLCTNSPSFREYLLNDVRITMPLEPYGIMIDDPIGTTEVVNRHGGCYCKYCMIGFREYLKAHFSRAQMASKGIIDVDKFDLRQFHQPYSNLPPERRPLRKEFLDFQMESSARLFREVTAYAQELSGRRLPCSGNINPTIPLYGNLLQQVDYFSSEIGMDADSGTLGRDNSLFVFKLADALGRPAAIMGFGKDHAFIKEKELPGMLRCWIAEAYAFGNYFVVPYYLFTFTPGKGAGQFFPPKTEIAPLYQFIRSNAGLFDGHESLARVAILYSHASFRSGSQKVRQMATKLADMNIPFDLVIAGDDVLDMHLTANQLNRYDILIVPSDAILSDYDRKVINDYRASNHAIIDEGDRLSGFSTRLTIKGVKNIRTSVRSSTDGNTRTISIHLLNRNYGVISDSCDTARDFVLSIPAALFGNTKIGIIKYYRPPSWQSKNSIRGNRQETTYLPMDLSFSKSKTGLDIKVPYLDSWGIIALIPK